MSRQFFSEAVTWVTADGTAVSNTATETIVFPNVTIPANFMQDGRILRILAKGRWSNVVTAQPTIIWALRWGGVAGTVLAQTAAITTTTGAITSAPWSIELLVQTRANGSSGSLFVIGDVMMSPGAAPTFGTVANYGLVYPMTSTGTTVPAAVTVDLTADTALSLTGKWSAANAANAFQGHLYVIEALN